MTFPRLHLGLGGVLVCVAGFGLADEPKAVPARSWPMFGGTGSRNMVNTIDKNVPTQWNVKTGQNVKWTAPLGRVSYGGPVVAGEKVYVGTNNEVPRDPKIKGDKGVLMCFQESDGKFLWQIVHNKLPNPMENDWAKQGIASTPAVDGDRVYYISNRCELICADTDGKIVWRLDMPGKLDVYPRYLASSSPMVVGDLVYTVTSNGVTGDSEFKVKNPKAPSFIAVDKKGNVAWKDNSPGDKIMEGQWTNPTYAEVAGKGQVIFPGGDGWLYSFEAKTGKPVWKFDCNPKDSEYKPGGQGATRSYFLATPVVLDNKVYIGVGNNPDDGGGVGHFWCIDITKQGDVSPDLVVDAKATPPKTKPNPNSAAVWHYGGEVPMAQQEKEGRDYYFGRTLSTAAVHDGLVYISELMGYLHCLDAKTGKPYWVHDLKSGVWGSPYWVDGKIYLGTEDGDVWIFQHGKEKREPTKNPMPGSIKGPVVVVNGVLYVMTGSQLYAIAAKK